MYITLFSYIRMSIILQELAQSPASPTANRCPQMASEEDARNITFEAGLSLCHQSLAVWF